MSRRRHHHHLPTATEPPRRTPLRSLAQALTHVELVLARPLEPETCALFVDAQYLPLTCMVVEGPARKDDVLGVADLATVIGREQHASHVVFVSSRPGAGFEAADVERWFALDHLVGSSGIGLLEWFVCGDQLTVPVSALVGEPSRWPGDPA